MHFKKYRNEKWHFGPGGPSSIKGFKDDRFTIVFCASIVGLKDKTVQEPRLKIPYFIISPRKNDTLFECLKDEKKNVFINVN